MLDPLAFAMTPMALDRQRRRFDGRKDVPSTDASPSLGRVRLGMARRLRAVADRIEPVTGGETGRSPAMAFDRRDAA